MSARCALFTTLCIPLFVAALASEARARKPTPFHARAFLLEGTTGVALANTARHELSNTGLSLGAAVGWRPKDGYAFPLRFQFGQIAWEERPSALPLKWSRLTLAFRVYVIDTSKLDFHVEPLSIGPAFTTTPENQCSNVEGFTTQPALGVAWHASPEFSLGVRLSYAFQRGGSICTLVGGRDRRPVIDDLDMFDSSLLGTFHFGAESTPEPD